MNVDVKRINEDKSTLLEFLVKFYVYGSDKWFAMDNARSVMTRLLSSLNTDGRTYKSRYKWKYNGLIVNFQVTRWICFATLKRVLE